jgi:hypothetical protein
VSADELHTMAQSPVNVGIDTEQDTDDEINHEYAYSLALVPVLRIKDGDNDNRYGGEWRGSEKSEKRHSAVFDCRTSEKIAGIAE